MLDLTATKFLGENFNTLEISNVTTISTILFIGGIAWLLLPKTDSTLPNEPPCLPYRLPWLAHGLQFRSDSLELIDRAHKYFKSTGPFTVNLAGQRYYIVTNASEIASILRQPKTLSFNEFISDFIVKAWGMTLDERPNGAPNVNGMLYGGEFNGVKVDSGHDYFRNAFNKPDRFNTILTRTATELSRHARIALDELSSGEGCIETTLLEWVKRTLACAVSDAVFGHELRKNNPDVIDDVFALDNGLHKLFEQLPRWMAKSTYEARDRLFTIFERYLDDEAMCESADYFISGRNAQVKAAGVGAKDRAGITLSMFHGMNTNANPAGFWCLIRILTYPGLTERIIKETAPAIIRDGPIQVNWDLLDREHCPLLHSVWLESLRVGTNALSVRRVMEETVIGGFTFYPGSMVIHPPRLMQMSTEHWGENAAVFDPERFLNIPDNDPIMGKLRPFGGGASYCLGRFFAALEIKMFVVLMIAYFDFEVLGPVPEADDKTLGASVMKPLRDIPIRVKRRKSV